MATGFDEGEAASPSGEVDELVNAYLDAAVTRRDLRALEVRLDAVMDGLWAVRVMLRAALSEEEESDDSHPATDHLG